MDPAKNRLIRRHLNQIYDSLDIKEIRNLTRQIKELLPEAEDARPLNYRDRLLLSQETYEAYTSQIVGQHPHWEDLSSDVQEAWFHAVEWVKYKVLRGAK